MITPAHGSRLTTGPAAPDGDDAGLRARGLTMRFTVGGRQHTVLDGVDLDLEAGRMTALVGESGCGKSTLLRVLGLLTPPNAGTVHIDGRDAWRLSDNARSRLRRHHIGFVFQAANLIPQLRARHNVALAFDGSLARGRARADQLLDQMDLLDRSTSRSADLSGGEQQRVALARALVNGPVVLLADEPTGNLDPANATQVMRLLRSVAESGCAVLVVTHSDAVAESADAVLRLAQGRVTTERSAP